MVLRFRPAAFGEIHDYLLGQFNVSRSAAKHLAHASLGKPALAAKLCDGKDYYARYVETASSFLLASFKDLNERIMITDSLISKTKAEDPAIGAKGILDVWTGVVRDLLLLNCGNSDLIQNEFMRKELSRAVGKYSAVRLVGLHAALVRAGEYIDSNVNPRLALESVMMEL